MDVLGPAAQYCGKQRFWLLAGRIEVQNFQGALKSSDNKGPRISPAQFIAPFMDKTRLFGTGV